ncbi:lecithin retinol acyltransferase-like [Perca fluviatilis]|uniref:lecithin retinol acyltransferase-like n=1 Tax=Perca fluviatilis TaxID=8168 RepID=UPI0019631547|nr:lecithin retinol acyltransferase-like [Perca fluviatilis]
MCCLQRGSVRVDSVEDFAYGSEILINTMDKVCNVAAVIDYSACSNRLLCVQGRLQGDMSYSLLWYNCEHYVMYCRYGTVASFQTFQFCKTARKLLLSRRVAKATAALCACLLLFLDAVTACNATLAVLLPFLIWMAA